MRYKMELEKRERELGSGAMGLPQMPAETIWA